MPYLTPEDKKHLEQEAVVANDIRELGVNCRTAGELNYTITRILQGYLLGKKKCYQTMNDIMGALEGAKIEFYRRTIAPYENEKIQSNGDL